MGPVITENDTTRAAGSLSYNLYSDPKFAKKWGTASGPEALSGTYKTEETPVPVYGRLAPSQSSAPLTHSEDLTMSVDY